MDDGTLGVSAVKPPFGRVVSKLQVEVDYQRRGFGYGGLLL